MGRRGPKRVPTGALVKRGSRLAPARAKAERAEREEAKRRVESGKIKPCDIPGPYKLSHVRQLATGDFRGPNGFCKPHTKKQHAIVKRGWDVLQGLVFQYLCLRTFQRRGTDPRLLPWYWWQNHSEEPRDSSLLELEQLAKMFKLGPVLEVYEPYVEMMENPDASREYLTSLFRTVAYLEPSE